MTFIRRLIVFSLLLTASCGFILYELQSSNDAMIRFLYGTRFGALLRKAVTANPYASSLVGWFTNRSLSRYAIGGFVASQNINLNETQRSEVCQYISFNDFFTRELKPGARTIDEDPQVIVSPADGQIYVVQNLSPTSELIVKEKAFSIEKLLNNTELAHNYYGGTAYIVYLAPHNYHRFHFPLDCTPQAPITISGKYESVNLLVYRLGFQPLTENERHLIMLKTQTVGDVAFVAVGALCVGKITETFTPNEPVLKGAEAGYYSFGGSTVVLLFAPNTITIDPELTKATEFVTIQMGQKIGSIKSKSLEDLD